MLEIAPLSVVLNRISSCKESAINKGETSKNKEVVVKIATGFDGIISIDFFQEAKK